MQLKQSSLTTRYQSPWSFRCFSLHLRIGIWWLFRLSLPPPFFLHYKQHGIDHICICLPVNLLVILQGKDQEVKLLGGRKCEFKKKKSLLVTPNCPPKSPFQFISSLTVQETPFAIPQENLLLSIFLHFCANLMCEKWVLAIILVCFPLITSETVHLFKWAICLSSANYLLIASFIFVWEYLSLFCWFIRLSIFYVFVICYVGSNFLPIDTFFYF